MAKKLYLFEVTRTTDMIVVAESRDEAVELARDNANNAMDDAYPDTDVGFWRDVNSEKDLVATGWDRHAIPYGGGDDKTVGEYLDDIAEERKIESSAAKQLPLLPEDKK